MSVLDSLNGSLGQILLRGMPRVAINPKFAAPPAQDTPRQGDQSTEQLPAPKEKFAEPMLGYRSDPFGASAKPARATMIKDADTEGSAQATNRAFEDFLRQNYERFRQPKELTGRGVIDQDSRFDIPNQAEIVQRAMQAFGALRGLAGKDVEAQTNRGDSRVKELGVRVQEKGVDQEPAKLMAGLAQAEMQGQSQRDVAEIGRKAMSQQGLNATVAEAQKKGATPGEISRIFQSASDVENVLRGDAPDRRSAGFLDAMQGRLGIRSPGPAPSIAINPGADAKQSVDAATDKPKSVDSLKRLQDTAVSKNNTFDSRNFLAAVGLNPEGNEGNFGKYDLTKVLEQMTKADDTYNDETLDAVIGTSLKAGAGGLDKLRSDIAKAYMAQSRGAGLHGGAGKIKFQPTQVSNPLRRGVRFLDDNGQEIMVGEESSIMPWLTGTSAANPLGQIALWGTPASGMANSQLWGKDEARRKAIAAERLLRRALQYQAPVR